MRGNHYFHDVDIVVPPRYERKIKPTLKLFNGEWRQKRGFAQPLVVDGRLTVKQVPP